MKELTCMSDLSETVRAGVTDWSPYGHVRVAHHDGLLLFNYTQEAEREWRWNWFERASRGLILDAATGEVVARPFDKFFGWGQRGETGSGHFVLATEKTDGSLGIHYRWRGEHSVATRGSFRSEQAVWATEHLQKNHDLSDLPDELTLIFEIVYPENRVVVDYGDREALVLLATRNRFTGEHLPFIPDVRQLAERHGFPTPRAFPFRSVDKLRTAAKTLAVTAEGWVVLLDDGTRWKIKGDQYVEAHKMLSSLSRKNIARFLLEGRFDEKIAVVPEELRGVLYAERDDIVAQADALLAETESAFASVTAAVGAGDRKSFALRTRERWPWLSPYLFARLDGRDVRELVYRKMFL